MFNILKLNSISSNINEILNENYNLVSADDNPDGIIVRSFKMQNYKVNDKLVAVARAGAGVNNIPIEQYAEKGIVVFNTPGANANAVKELVLCSMIMASRNIVNSISWVNTIKGKGADVPKLVEDGKANFIGNEIMKKKLGVIGLGAIGSLVANTAVNLGMEVYGYDPYITVDTAWGLSNKVRHETDINRIFYNCDYITVHIPLLDSTTNFINEKTINKMKDGVIIINCARGELVNTQDIIAAVKSNKVKKYVTDFPNDDLIGIENIITIPHLGASTPEAEDNCAAMAAKELKDYLENGNIVNSVNMPQTVVARSGVQRITIIHKTTGSMVSNTSTILAEDGINTQNVASTSKGNLAYTIIDVDAKLKQSTLDKISKIEGLIRIRVI